MKCKKSKYKNTFFTFFITFGLACVLYPISFAQNVMSLSLFNHATALPPNGFSGPLHPGLDVGISSKIKMKAKSSSYLLWKAGYYYHRLVHHGIQLYTEYNKLYPLTEDFGLSWSGGLGYLHTFELHEKFKLQPEGNYERTGRMGKPHAQVSVSAGLFYQFQSITPFIQYRVRMITPFVNSYVPLLPSTSIHLGIYYTLNPKTTKS